ncbi:protocatechuate 3,4-dioxygenase subunit alpha [Mycobacterium sp. 852002-40037_SCH5390672]|uniref:protocatechuate 3,4-dioxygenase subunit alpha n=1 Tax=Mycobacterium sp. 852002-40037_SCH5390672 TaxID=1834089 RepID=UPI0008049473|nr:protocatechuate 3,4-dioxygenase subunit alpha [Mycobacterium sp. 852002-40037_SCH5390672]OBB93448.1 protocatechuate 3,4-dioxygenase subunit alpha [Mycobacterium sp. 852002-40037_SCH5390672]
MAESSCTPGQTVGPFLDLGLPYPGGNQVVGDGHPQAIRLHGRVYDGAGAAVPDALVELWQPDGAGRVPRQAGSLRRDHTVFTGWGRCATDAEGSYTFTTLAPGTADAGRSPFFALTVFARGLLNRLFTRAYLPGANPHADPLLATVTAERRNTLLCVAENGGAAYRFDIHLQGPAETVFLAFREDAR